MAQRNSRKGGGKTKKRPELRTGGGRQAKAERAAQRERHQERSAGSGAPTVRMRPAGVAGVVTVQLVAWAGIALLAYVAYRLGRWGELSYPDSLWLYLAVGVLAVATAVGRVARTERDADTWGAEALLVPLVVFLVTAFAGPGCPTGGNCAAIGAGGAMGPIWSVVLIVAFAVGAWGIARWQFRAASAKRPAKGRVRVSTTITTMVFLLVFPGALIGAGFIALDSWLRDTPALAASAKTEAERECYGLVAAPDLSVRAAPNGYNPEWTTFAVRRTDESRPGVGKQSLPSNWATLDYVHPYEATVSYTADGQLVNVTCRRLGPGTGNAVKEDLQQDEPSSNPLSPKTTGSQFLPRFFTQGVAGPVDGGTTPAAAKAKAKAKVKVAKAKAADSGGN